MIATAKSLSGRSRLLFSTQADCLALGSSRGSSVIVARGEEKYMALGGKMVNVVVESQ